MKKWQKVLALAAALVLCLCNGSAALGAAAGDIPTVDIKVTKTWVGDNEGIRPTDIHATLYGYTSDVFDKTTATKLRNSDEIMYPDWNKTFQDVPVYNTNGEKYKYQVEEDPVPTGYTATVTHPVVDVQERISVGTMVKTTNISRNAEVSLGDSNVVVLKNGNNYLLWTLDHLTDETQKKQLFEKGVAAMSGNDKE